MTETHTIQPECTATAHTAFIPALGTRIRYPDHETLIEGVYALYEREYGPNDIHIYPSECPEAGVVH